jgi:hypothetical protein
MTTFDEHAAQRTVIQFCADAGMSPLETVRKMHKTDRFKNVSRALVYKWHGRFTPLEAAGTELNVMGRPKILLKK